MKLQKYIALPLAAAFLAGLAACGGSASAATSNASPVLPAGSAVASKAEANMLAPLPTFSVPLDSSALTTKIMPDASVTVVPSIDDGTYAATLESDLVISVASGATATELYGCTTQLYSYDQYDMVAVNTLTVGDTISTHTDDETDETEQIKIESIEVTDSGLVTINGGVEEGGLYLLPEDTVYRTLTLDDYPAYYPVGETLSLAFAKDVVLRDSSADPHAEAQVTTGDAAVAAAIAADATGAGFSCANTTITVEGGLIVEIDRIWVP